MEKNINLRDIISKNIVLLRKSRNWTQLDVANKLNYSDKAVSKWERSESIPDIVVLKQIADLYSVTLDELTSTNVDIKKQKSAAKMQKIIIPSLSVGLLLLITTIFFVLLVIFNLIPNPWIVYIYSLPLSAIILIVFNSFWGNKLLTGIYVSVLIWTLILSIQVSIRFENSWLLYIIGAPLEILIIEWFVFKKKTSKNIS